MERPIRTKYDISACILTLKPLPKIIVIGPQGLVLPIKVKSVNWGLEHMERPIRTKFDRVSIQAQSSTAKNYRYRSTESGTCHISQIGKLGS